MMMDWETLREWLIQNGIPAEELDEISELPVLTDIGNALVLLMTNTDNIGQAMVQMAMDISKLKSRLEALENA